MTKVNKSKNSSLWKSIKKGKWGYIMIAPLIIGLLIFSYYPSVSGLVLSFFNKSSTETSFAGFDNFTKLFKDEIFLNSIGTMFKIMIPKLLISIIAPLIMAELIFAVKCEKLGGAFRVLTLIPIVAPGVVSMLIWRNILSVDGLLTDIAKLLGFVEGDAVLDWLGALGNDSLVLFSVVFIGFPWVGGTSVLIYTAGLNEISAEVMDAAKLDGASNFKRIFYIDLPLLTGQIKYFLIFGIIGGLQDYGIQYTITDGGPGYSTYVPGYYLYKLAFAQDNMGYAAAIGVLLFVVTFLLSVFMFRFMDIGGMKKQRGVF